MPFLEAPNKRHRLNPPLDDFLPEPTPFEVEGALPPALPGLPRDFAPRAKAEGESDGVVTTNRSQKHDRPTTSLSRLQPRTNRPHSVPKAR